MTDEIPNVFSFDDYRSALKAQLEARKVPLRGASEALGVQATYLSRVLGSGEAHMSDDLLFELCHFLGLDEKSVDYLCALKGRDTTASPARRTRLGEICLRLRSEHAVAPSRLRAKETSEPPVGEPLDYWMNPFAPLVHAALELRRFQSDPRALCAVFGLSREVLDDTMGVLDKHGFLTWDKTRTTLLEVRGATRFLSRAHALFRAHQTLLQTLARAQVLRLRSEDVYSVEVTFTCGEDVHGKIRAHLSKALEDIRSEVEREALATRRRGESVRQLSLTLFPWT